MIPSRAWDTEGVTTLQAINTPFLITSDSLLAEVVSGPLADDMMSGLDDIGVVGLALLPEVSATRSGSTDRYSAPTTMTER